MTAEIRTVLEADWEEWDRAVATGFLNAPVAGSAAWRRPSVDLDRCLGAFEDGRPVGTFRSFPTELTLPGGGQVAVAGVTNVTVTATHRRQGLLTRMMERDLRDDAERGEVAAILIASEWPIYGRYGYGQATERLSWQVDATAVSFRSPGEGDLALVDAETARAEMPAIYERRRLREPGQIPYEDFRWDYLTGLRPAPGRTEPHRWFVLSRSGGRAVGYLVYHLDEKWEESRPRYTVQVDKLFGDSPEVEARLWRYCCEMDWVRSVQADTRSPGDVLPLLLGDARAAVASERTDHVWVRPLDVPRLLGARRYPFEGRVTLEVHDDAEYASGTFTVEGGPDGAACRAGGEPDVALDASTLGSASLGGHSLAVLARAGLVEERRPGGIQRAAAFLGWVEPPWCSVWF